MRDIVSVILSKKEPIAHRGIQPKKDLPMQESAIVKAEGKGGSPRLFIFRFIAISLFTLNLLAAIVMFLIPLGVLRPLGIFPGRPEGALWLLFIFSLAFGIILFNLGAAKGARRRLSHGGGSNYLFLGLVAALEIFLVNAHPFNAPDARSTTSLWWLFVTYTVLGGIGVYLPVRAERLERKAAEKEEELKAKEVGKVDLRIVRVKVRH
jgi:hypothetical protein